MITPSKKNRPHLEHSSITTKSCSFHSNTPTRTNHMRALIIMIISWVYNECVLHYLTTQRAITQKSLSRVASSLKCLFTKIWSAKSKAQWQTKAIHSFIIVLSLSTDGRTKENFISGLATRTTAPRSTLYVASCKTVSTRNTSPDIQLVPVKCQISFVLRHTNTSRPFFWPTSSSHSLWLFVAFGNSITNERS